MSVNPASRYGFTAATTASRSGPQGISAATSSGRTNSVAAAKPAFEKYGARFLARGGAFEATEGKRWARNVVIEFPSLKAAQDCYHSPEYTAARAIRRKFADAEMVLVEGVFD